jgi:vacuolar-type H+-ATPase subunit D/Vma8
MLEERVQPELKYQVKFIAQYIGEREREAYYNLKMAKERILS